LIDFIGRKFKYKKKEFIVHGIHCTNSVWATGAVQYECRYLPLRKDLQYKKSWAFECFSLSKLSEIFKKDWELFD